MANPPSYCDYIRSLPKLQPSVHREYHNHLYGFPVGGDNALFERLVLEINQAGLSWTTILNKQKTFHLAYDGFKIQKVAGYGKKDIRRLLSDPGVIRNRLKVHAAISNAQAVLVLQKRHGSFRRWLDAGLGQTLEEWTKLFRSTFRFTGGEIVREFLVSTGYLPGAHDARCPAGRRARKAGPAWARN